MPARGIFSTGLPSRQPAARPVQAPCTRSRIGSTAGRPPRRSGAGAAARSRPTRSVSAAERGPASVELVQQLAAPAHGARATPAGRPHRSPRARDPAGRHPALHEHRATSLPSLGAARARARAGPRAGPRSASSRAHARRAPRQPSAATLRQRRAPGRRARMPRRRPRPSTARSPRCPSGWPRRSVEPLGGTTPRPPSPAETAPAMTRSSRRRARSSRRRAPRRGSRRGGRRRSPSATGSSSIDLVRAGRRASMRHLPVLRPHRVVRRDGLPETRRAALSSSVAGAPAGRIGRPPATARSAAAVPSCATSSAAATTSSQRRRPARPRPRPSAANTPAASRP